MVVGIGGESFSGRCVFGVIWDMDVDSEFGSVSMLSCLPITTGRFDLSSPNNLERILHRRHVVDLRRLCSAIDRSSGR